MRRLKKNIKDTKNLHLQEKEEQRKIVEKNEKLRLEAKEKQKKILHKKIATRNKK